jgi:hypothetical protein
VLCNLRSYDELIVMSANTRLELNILYLVLLSDLLLAFICATVKCASDIWNYNTKMVSATIMFLIMLVPTICS